MLTHSRNLPVGAAAFAPERPPGPTGRPRRGLSVLTTTERYTAASWRMIWPRMAGLASRRHLVGIVTVLFWLAGLLSSCGAKSVAAPATGSTYPGGAPASGLVWSACNGADGPKGYQCATVAVPLNPESSAQPGTVRIALDRHLGAAPSDGVLLINPGGPGVSGVDFLPQVMAMVPRSVSEHFDVVGFDPPGVGHSDPVTCESSSKLLDFVNADPAPTSPGGFAKLVAADRAFAEACEKRSGRQLPYVSTVDAAIDMDKVREALGVTSISYLGFSYGTLLGATYADMFPNRVRAMVLDGAVNPDLGAVQSLDAQSDGFEAELDSMITSCKADKACPWSPGSDPLGAFESLMASVAAHPLPVRGSSQPFGLAQFLYATGAGLYTPSSWPTLETGLALLGKGDPSVLHGLFDSYIGLSSSGVSNEFEAEAAVTCLDTPAPSLAALEAAAPAAEKAAPVFGLFNLYSEALCSVWPVPATGRPRVLRAVGSPPIVVVATTGDPATPYAEGVALAGQLQHGVLLTRVGEGHTAYAYSSCIRSYVNSYLLDLTVPPPGVRCPSD